MLFYIGNCKSLKLRKNKNVRKLFELAAMLLLVTCFDIKKVELTLTDPESERRERERVGGWVGV